MACLTVRNIWLYCELWLYGTDSYLLADDSALCINQLFTSYPQVIHRKSFKPLII
ncbi:uncharacterized protein METZ01_LOCUS187436 [marine metagenome]|uniref:Uncharacterized protein n=1 Tax=marine metagenome TaxID=408172 RepID=A0A382D970_9ZZZZ